MPHQENANKRPKLLDFCIKHPNLNKDMLCSTHNTMQCTLCCSKEHQNCVVDSIHEISTVKIKEFYDVINGFKKTLESVMTAVSKSVNDTKATRQKLLEEAKDDYDKIIKNANDFLEETKRQIREKSERHLKVQLQDEIEIKNLNQKLDKKLASIKTFIGKSFTEKHMLRMQEFVESITRYADDFKKQYPFLSFVQLYLELNKQTSKFMRTSHNSFGCLRERKSDSVPTVSVPDITFPVSSSRDVPTSLSFRPPQDSSAVSLFSVSAAKSLPIVSSTYRSPLAASTTSPFASNSTVTNMIFRRRDTVERELSVERFCVNAHNKNDSKI